MNKRMTKSRRMRIESIRITVEFEGLSREALADLLRYAEELSRCSVERDQDRGGREDK